MSRLFAISALFRHEVSGSPRLYLVWYFQLFVPLHHNFNLTCINHKRGAPYIDDKEELPQCYFSCSSQVNSCCYYTQCLEHFSHRRDGYTITSFQSGNLCSFHSYTLTKLLLGQVLFYTSFFDSFTQSVSM